ncbi:hypothetical protein ACP4OV_026293 [Aristida adscensionis]
MDPLPVAFDPRQQGEAVLTTEQVFEAEPVPSRAETITTRSVAVGVVLGAALSVVTMKLKLATGLMPSLTIPAGLLAFFLPPVWVRVKDLFELAHVPFTRQENTVIQTFVVACSSIAYSGKCVHDVDAGGAHDAMEGGFESYVLARSRGSGGATMDGDSNVDEPRLGRLIVFFFLTSFAGMLAILPFRNILIIRHRMPFPSGAAVAHLINTIHRPQGAKQASKQASILFKTFFGTIGWTIFEWFFTAGNQCGFKTFPTFGLTAYGHGFYYNFSTVTIGIGMLSTYKITISMLVGSLVSWGIMWPYIETKKGNWYDPRPNYLNLSGIDAYQVFTGISIILADGIFHLLYILFRTLYGMYNGRHTQQQSQQAAVPFQCLGVNDWHLRCFDDERREQVFLHDKLFIKASLIGYVALSAISAIVIPQLYPQLRHYHVIFSYLVIPLLAFCATCVGGTTDMNIKSAFSNIAMLIFGSCVGLKNGGMVVGLVACGIFMSAISTATNLMMEFRTGYLTLTSPHTILISQAAGTAFGCVVNPVIFWIFCQVYDGSDITPFARLYRNFSRVATSYPGLPKHSLLLCEVFFALGLAINILQELSVQRRWRIGQYLPSTIAVAVAFLVPPSLSIGIFMGGMVMYLWRRLDNDTVRLLSPVVAAGLICGEGFGSLLTTAFKVVNMKAPICMMFLPRDSNKRLDAFLATLPGA